jgi:carbon monoxide dehydrogenase subunit G
VELNDEFTVGLPVERAFALLADVERIAPCLPGAELQEVAGEEYRGTVRVKVGPITAQYKGVARFLEQDGQAHRMVLRAEGRETRGQGNASATVTADLAPQGAGTRVRVVTDLTITGKVAQFGRGMLAEVSKKLLAQFVTCLEANVLASPGGAQDVAAAPAASGAAPFPAPSGAASAPAPAPSGAASPQAPSGAASAREGGAGAASGSAPAVAGRAGEAVAAPVEAPDRTPLTGAPGAPAAAVSPASRGEDTAEGPAGGASGSAAPAAEPPPAVDLVRLAGPSVLKRLVPALAGLLGLAAVLAVLARRRRGGTRRR